MPRHEAERTVDGQGHFNVTKATVTSLPLCPTVVTNLYHEGTVMVLQNTRSSCTVSPAVGNSVYGGLK
jgi:hypothetical protein